MKTTIALLFCMVAVTIADESFGRIGFSQAAVWNAKPMYNPYLNQASVLNTKAYFNPNLYYNQQFYAPNVYNSAYYNPLAAAQLRPVNWVAPRLPSWTFGAGLVAANPYGPNWAAAGSPVLALPVAGAQFGGVKAAAMPLRATTTYCKYICLFKYQIISVVYNRIDQNIN